MREIKFRVWDNQKLSWANEYEAKERMGLKFITKDYFDNIAGEKSARWYFMQYTGLKDKDGVEIFEGDLLGGKGEVIYKVVYDNGAFYLNHIQKYMPKRWGLLNRLFDCDMKELYANFKVIGNIYEIPENLKDYQDLYR